MALCVAIVPGTDGGKMSKSLGNVIQPLAPAKLLKKQVMGIVTDSTPVEDPKDPETCNVFALLKLLAPERELPTGIFHAAEHLLIEELVASAAVE